MKKWFEEKILSSNRNTILFLTISIFFVLFVYQIFLLINNTYFNSNSDDVAQYSLILSEYIDKFKEGKLSLYNFNNGLGASTFADIYYIPIDIFSLLTFVFSYVMNNLIAFSCVELIKVLLGVVTFAYFLQSCKFSNKIVTLVSFIYFCCGGSWVFATYPTYFSLFFYLPACLMVIKWYLEGKKWILPLYSFALVLYNFYNAYSLFVFMVIVYIILKIRDDYRGIKQLVKDTICYGLHIVLGVLLGAAILIPSVFYILNYSSRNIVDFEVLFDFEIYVHMLYRLFVYESGVSNLNLSVGVIGTYYNRHFSYYMGFLCLYIIVLMFFMKDRTSKVYKWSIVAFIIMMCIPVFSMIFSGVAVAYTRWFTFINILLLYYFAHMLSVIKIDDIKKSDKIKVLVAIILMYVIVLVYNVIRAVEHGETAKVYFYYSIFIMLMFGIIGGMYLLFYLVKQRSLMQGVLIMEMLVALLINLSVPVSSNRVENLKSYSDIEDKLMKQDVEENSLQRTYLDFVGYNLNRVFDDYTNEITFHSFMTKYIYNYFDLYKEEDEEVKLVLPELNIFSPYFSRVIDYKYLIDIKDERSSYIDYMDVVYEDEEFIIYENKDYNEFYVYENYYEEEDVKQYNGENNLFVWLKSMFKGAVLESGKHNLNRIQYNFDDANQDKLHYIYKTSLKKENDGYVEFVDFKYDYSGTVYIRGEDLANLKEVKISNKDKLNACDYIKGTYQCSFEGIFDKIIFEANKDITELEYLIAVEEEQNSYSFISVDYLSEDYVLYHDAINSVMERLVAVNKDYEKRECYTSFCVLQNFDTDHFLGSFYLDAFTEGKKIELIYQEDDLSYYNEYKKDIYATNKSLTYDKETINIKYDRISSSDKDQVVVLPITYSDEWVCEDENYELVRANGGFLGVIVKNGTKNVDVSITFKPAGVKLGVIVSCVGFAMYGLYVLLIYLNKKRGKNDDIQKTE